MSDNTARVSSFSSSRDIFNLNAACGHLTRITRRPDHRAMKTAHGFAFDGKRAPIALTGPTEFTCFCGVVTEFGGLV